MCFCAAAVTAVTLHTFEKHINKVVKFTCSEIYLGRDICLPKLNILISIPLLLLIPERTRELKVNQKE